MTYIVHFVGFEIPLEILEKLGKNQIIINAVYDYILAWNYTVCVRFDRKWYIDVAYIDI